MDIKLENDEVVDDLQYKGLKIIQNNKWFKYGIDSVILSDFARHLKDNSIVVDIGTGTGIIGLLLCGKTKLKKIYGIEIQSNVAEMARKSIALNNLEDRFEIINKDIIDISNQEILKNNSIDYIVMNPPYKEKRTGIINEKNEKIISRHETTATLEDFIKISSKLLRDKGTIYMVHRPERLVDIFSIMRKHKIEPKRIRLVYPSIDKEPNIVLIEGIKGALKFLKVEKPLVIYRDNGDYTKEIKEIYNIKEG